MSLAVDAKPGYLFILPWTLATLGGVTQVVDNLTRQMERGGEYAPLLMVNCWEARQLRSERINGCLHYFYRLRSIWTSQKRLRNMLACFIFLPSELYSFHKFVRSHGITVINVHYCGIYALDIGILRMLGLLQGKLILSFHGKDLLEARASRGLERLLWKILLRSADRIVTCSESLKKSVAAFDPRCADAISAIHNGIDVACLEREQDNGYPLDPRLSGHAFLLNVATFEHKKGQDLLIKAFADLSGRFPDLRLVMIGRPGEAIDQLQTQIRSFGLERRIILYDGLPHNRIGAFYKEAALFVLPSRYEPFGIVVLEAGFFSKPVVAANVGGIGEILTHGQTGRLCQPEDSGSLARELIDLMEHPEERQRLGSNLRRHVLENFSWEKAYRKYLECIAA